MITWLSLYQLALYVVSFFVYSFLGWVWELCFTIVEKHKLVNRGFVFGPVLPIYGAGALAALLLIRPIGNVAAQFAAGCLLAVAIEYPTSWLMEKLFHARWWDYTGKPFNLNGRVYLPGVVCFSAMMLVCVHVAQPLVEAVAGMVPENALVLAAVAMLVVFSADLASTVAHTQSFMSRLDLVQLRLGDLKDTVRQLADRTLTAATDAMEDARGAMGEARRSLTGEARTGARRAAGIEELKDLGLNFGLNLNFAGLDRDAIEAKIRSAASKLLNVTRFERRTLSDPYFKPTKSVEAYEWVRKLLANGKTRLAEACGNEGEASGRDGQVRQADEREDARGDATAGDAVREP